MALLVCCATQGRAETVRLAGANVGSAGHYLTGGTRVYLLNEEGKDFKVSLHRYNWPFKGSWNRRDPGVRITGPEKKLVVEPGNDGRLWSLEVRLGGGHTYSDINLALEGVLSSLNPVVAVAPFRTGSSWRRPRQALGRRCENGP